jgi:ankyrin repeat/SOCS box protein 13/metal transporter CNNM
MGLLSLDVLSLKVLKGGGTPKERKYATKILPIVQKHHLLLVTLLLANAAAVEAMPIFLDRVSSPIVAVAVSVSAVLLFGEIIPQALCTRYGLAIGYYLSPFVRVLIFLLFIIAWPISKLLDVLLGKDHSTFFRRAELKHLVSLHEQGSQENEEPLSHDEVLIIKGALEMRSKVVRHAMAPLQSAFMLDINDRLDRSTMEKILKAGYSRIPVYKGERSNIIGIVLVKSLILLDPDDATPVCDVCRPVDGIPHVQDDMPLYDLLNKFQEGKSHMSQVWGRRSEQPTTPQQEESSDRVDASASAGPDESVLLGIITLEDVIEELIQEEIVDETDVFVDVHKRILVARAKLRKSQSVNEDELRQVRVGQSRFKRAQSVGQVQPTLPVR